MSAKTKKMLAERIQKHRRALWDWHLSHAKKAPPPFYCSIDLRDSGDKIVPVDSNLYPAGFNNICPEDLRAAPPILRAQIDSLVKKETQKILILPESHTTNLNYIENLYYLSLILKNAGYDVRVGWYNPLPEGVIAPLQLKSTTDKVIEAWPIKIENQELFIEGFVPDLIILNNDFSGGYPDNLDQVRQPILPSHKLGWHTRKKSTHFTHYNELAAEFAKIIDIDPWLIQIDTVSVDHVNFNEEQGIDQVAEAAKGVFERTQLAYDRHSIKKKPFVFIKNNSGTYGMGIMVVRSVDEIKSMNRRTKNKMSVGKNKQQIQSVAIQEGVPKATLVDRLAAEPVIYLSGCELIGGFLRTNSERNDEDNLNSQGMVFRKLCMSDLRKPEDDPADDESKSEPVLELVYGSIARISALAAGRELLAAEAPRK